MSYPNEVPSPAVALGIVALASRLPGGTPASLQKAMVVAERATAQGWGEQVGAIAIWRQLDWPPVYKLLGNALGWTAELIHRIPPRLLLRLLEAHDAVPRADGTRGRAA